MAGVSLARAERLENALAKTKEKLREGARLGSNSMIAGLGGGVMSGLVEAKYPNLLNTNVSTSGAAGAALVLLALTGYAGDYSDEIAALGSGMLAATISREAEKYFND